MSGKKHRGRKWDRTRLLPVHVEDPARPNWCLCGLAGMYETPGVWVCYRSRDTTRPGPVSLTRSGIIRRR